MKNLAGVDKADETILEELYLAGLEPIKIDKGNTEVPYTYIAKIGNWTFSRSWRYWVARVDDGIPGLILKVALELHNTKHPTKDLLLGDVIRSGGHGSGPSPDEYGAQPIYNESIDEKLLALGYKKEYSKFLNKEYVRINVGEVSKLISSGKLKVDSYVDCYHIDDQIGLTELVKVLKNEFRNI